jgi:hypothetical protein
MDIFDQEFVVGPISEVVIAAAGPISSTKAVGR